MAKKKDTPFSFLDVDQELLETIVSHDYTSVAVAEMITNRSRTINYWRSGDEDLLPPWNGEDKRRKFSFSDLVWLGIVKTLTDFGLEKKVIFVLKNEVFSPVEDNVLAKSIDEDRAAVEKILSHQFKTTKTEIKQFLDSFIEITKQNKHKFTKLTTYIFSYFGNRTPTYLLVNKTGNHFLFTQETFKLELHNPKFLEFFNASHISVPISPIINSFLLKDFIKDEVKQSFFSEKEWELFWLIRKEKPESVTVVDPAGEKQLIKVTKTIYATLEQRLSEIITKGGYEEIIIKTQNGRIVNCKKIINLKQW